MYQLIETGNRFTVKDENGEVFNVVYFRVYNGCTFEAVILNKGTFIICPARWKIIDNEALAGKARALFARFFPEVEKQAKETA